MGERHAICKFIISTENAVNDMRPLRAMKSQPSGVFLLFFVETTDRLNVLDKQS